MKKTPENIVVSPDTVWEQAVVSAGPLESVEPYKRLLSSLSFLIAVDGGMGFCRQALQVPDIWLGDMDSSREEDSIWAEAHKVKRVLFPRDKDYSDSELAIHWIAEHQPACSFLVCLGFLGGRLDHALFNLMALSLIGQEHGLSLCFWSPGRRVLSLKAGQAIELRGFQGWTCSLLPLKSVLSKLSVSGMHYLLHDTDIPWPSTRTLSNVVNKKRAHVSSESPLLICLEQEV